VAQRRRAGCGVGVGTNPRRGGTALPTKTRGQMEHSLGADLSAAKIHTGGDSAQAAESLGARAMTVGNDVHFGAGQYAPGTKEGDRLIAHELTHVVQGQRSGIQRKADGADSAGAEVSQPHEPAEKEADAVADHVTGQLHGEPGAAAGAEQAGGAGGGAHAAGAGDHAAAAKPAAQAPALAAKLRPDVVHRNPLGGHTPPAGAPAAGVPAAPAYDPKTRKPLELWTDCADPAKRALALPALVAHGYIQANVEKILAHDGGRTPRAFVSIANEDAHIVERHVLDGSAPIPDKKALALRVLRNKPPCPGKAGAFHTAAAANASVSAAVAALAWPALRDKIARGVAHEEDVAVGVTGEILKGNEVPAKALPPYAHPLGEGGRPLYPNDPEFAPEMAKLENPPHSGKYFKTTGKGKNAPKTPIVYDPTPLTTAVAPTTVHLRLLPDASHEGGWVIHSAWPA
jgi:hypothetical protein